MGRSSCWGFFLSGFWFGFAVLEGEAVIAGRDDVAMMGEPVEERGRHFGVAEYAGPLS